MAMPTLDPNASDFTRRYLNLADPRLDAEVMFVTDEFFASKDRMLNSEPAVFIPGRYDDHGKWMDGWETYRRRNGGYDHCIVRLARPGVVKGVDIDMSRFTSNFPPAASIEAAYLPDDEPTDATQWTEIASSTTLQDNSHIYVAATSPQIFTHPRLNIFSDGGIVHLRVYGQPQVDWKGADRTKLTDLVAVENGVYVVEANNEHFGSVSRMLMPGRSVNMGDGWETRRRREPGNNWCAITLANPGRIRKIKVDTAHLKDNFVDRISIQAVRVVGGTDSSLKTQAMFWQTLLPEQKPRMDLQHYYGAEIADLGIAAHVRFNMFPDGGTSCLRLWGVFG